MAAVALLRFFTKAEQLGFAFAPRAKAAAPEAPDACGVCGGPHPRAEHNVHAELARRAGVEAKLVALHGEDHPHVASYRAETAKKREVLRPGSRGGHGYYDAQGKWQYGDRPQFGPPAGFKAAQQYVESLPPELRPWAMAVLGAKAGGTLEREPPDPPVGARTSARVIKERIYDILARGLPPAVTGKVVRLGTLVDEAPPQQAEGLKIATALRRAADSMQAAIDRLADPAIGHQNVTARRASIAGGMFERSQQMTETQAILRRLADLQAAGEVPPILAGVRTRALVELLKQVNGRKFPTPVVNSSHLREVVDYVNAHPRSFTAEQRTRLRNLQAFGRSYNDYGKIVDEADIEAISAVVRDENEKQPKNQHGHRANALRRDWILSWALEWQHAKKAGLDTPERWAEAREAIAALKQAPTVDPHARVRALERKLIGRKIPGYYPTPPTASALAVKAAHIEPGMTVLEPSAGKGDMCEAIRSLREDAKITACEIVPDLADVTEAKGFTVVRGDFLEQTPDQLGRFDRVVMNPPFEGQADMDHVRHAFTFLKPGGVLVSIMSAGAQFRENKKAVDFREWVDDLGGTIERMPEASFATNATSDRITGVNTVLLTVHKPTEGLLAKAARWWRGAPAPRRRLDDLATRQAAIEKDLWYIDHEDLPALAGDDPKRPVLVKARAALLGELAAVELTLRKSRALHFQRRLGSLVVSVETRAGAYREWRAADGTEGRTKMPHHYGYVRGSLGIDGDHVDCFLGPQAYSGAVESSTVYVVNTLKRPDFQQLDEQKCLIGFPTWKMAKAAFLAAYGGEERYLGSVEALAWPAFVREVLATRPHGGLLRGERIAKAHINTYTRQGKGGPVQVQEHDDKRRAALPSLPAPRTPGAGAAPGSMAAPFAGGQVGWTRPVKTMTMPAEVAASSEEVASYIMSFVPALESTLTTLGELFPGVPVAGRIKETASLAEKLTRKGRALSDVEDVAGARLVFHSTAEEREAIARLRRSFTVRSEDDYLGSEKATGYRSHHFTVEVEGRPVEIQVRTERQTRWADYSHDTAYKAHGKTPPTELSSYLKGMAQYYAALDDEAPPPEPPDCPPIVRQEYGCLELT